MPVFASTKKTNNEKSKDGHLSRLVSESSQVQSAFLALRGELRLERLERTTAKDGFLKEKIKISNA